MVFIHAFAKNDKANISNKEKTALQLTAKDFLGATDKQLQVLISTKKYREVTADEQDS
ncbi:MAG: type II toxin-antitoxin system RelE/ParE family toxin [Chlorobiaceae bacterium]|nr:type II toxin-antitoxin system RelE/ParE family toxin [Chlorobiaceae bacterium]